MSLMDIDGVSNSVGKLEFFLREQDVIVDDIKKIRFADFYSNGFYQYIAEGIINNLNTISSMNRDNISYINIKKEGYINTSKDTSINFKKLGD